MNVPSKCDVCDSPATEEDLEDWRDQLQEFEKDKKEDNDLLPPVFECATCLLKVIDKFNKGQDWD